MNKLSVTIITLNEAKRIRNCLDSVSWADEIVVVDAYSADDTVKICSEYTDKIFKHHWDGYVKQKNFAMEQASNRWILSIDADEVVSPRLKKQIKQLIAGNLADIAGFYVRRQVFYLGRWIKHGGWYPDYKLRLFDKEKAHWGGGTVHEHIVCQGRTEKLSGELYHYSFENIAAHINTMNNFTTLAAQELAVSGRRVGSGDLLLRPAATFFKMYFLKLGFLDGLPGLVVATISSCHVFSKYAKLWELLQQNNPGNER